MTAPPSSFSFHKELALPKMAPLSSTSYKRPRLCVMQIPEVNAEARNIVRPGRVSLLLLAHIGHFLPIFVIGVKEL